MGDHTHPEGPGQTSVPHLRPFDRSAWAQKYPETAAAANEYHTRRIAEQAEIARLMAEYADERDFRVATHLSRLDGLTRRIARRVRARRLSVQDAEARLEHMAWTYDEDTPIPHLLVPYQFVRQFIASRFHQELGK